MLMGRKTHELFSPVWPNMEDFVYDNKNLPKYLRYIGICASGQWHVRALGAARSNLEPWLRQSATLRS